MKPRKAKPKYPVEQECLLIVRNPNGGSITFIRGDDGEPERFSSEDAADTFAGSSPVCMAWGYQVVKVTI